MLLLCLVIRGIHHWTCVFITIFGQWSYRIYLYYIVKDIYLIICGLANVVVSSWLLLVCLFVFPQPFLVFLVTALEVVGPGRMETINRQTKVLYFIQSIRQFILWGLKNVTCIGCIVTRAICVIKTCFSIEAYEQITIFSCNNLKSVHSYLLFLPGAWNHIPRTILCCFCFEKLRSQDPHLVSLQAVRSPLPQRHSWTVFQQHPSFHVLCGRSPLLPSHPLFFCCCHYLFSFLVCLFLACLSNRWI